ncbi:hypothetical protein ACEPAH_6541 [Sanghuangporus vaninii]
MPLAHEIHPADYFDVFGGTSTDGLIVFILNPYSIAFMAAEYSSEPTSPLKETVQVEVEVRIIFRVTRYSGRLVETLSAELVTKLS